MISNTDRRHSNPQTQDRAAERQRKVLTNSQSQNKATKQPYEALKSPYASGGHISSMNWCDLDFQDPDSYYPRNRQRRIADRNKVKQQIQLFQQNSAAGGDDIDQSFLRLKSTIYEEELHFLEIKRPFDVVDEDLSQLM